MVHASLSLLFSAQTDIGFVRENNEDAFKVLPEQRFFILADGMGGLNAGEIASKQCVDYLCELVQAFDPEIRKQNLSVMEATALLGAAIDRVNSAIYAQSTVVTNGKGMGTTFCCIYFVNESAIISHVGDSRIYRFKASESHEKKLVQLTEDHSLVNELIQNGSISKQEARLSPYKNILTKAIGIYPHVEPSVSTLKLTPSDLFLLCSDGLTNYATDGEIQEILTKIFLNKREMMAIGLQEATNQLISLAKSHGGGDNITVILILISL